MKAPCLAFLLALPLMLSCVGHPQGRAAASDSDYQELRDQGDAKADAGDHAAALALYQQARKLAATNDLAILMRIADAAARLRQSEVGREAIGAMVRIDPNLKDDPGIRALESELSLASAASHPEVELALATAETGLDAVRRALDTGDLAKANIQAWDACQELEPALADGNNLQAWVLAGRLALVLEQNLMAAYALEAILRLKPNAARDKDLRTLVGELNRRPIKQHLREISALRKRTSELVAKLRREYSPEESEAALTILEGAFAHVVKPEKARELLDLMAEGERAVRLCRHQIAWQKGAAAILDPLKRMERLNEQAPDHPIAITAVTLSFQQALALWDRAPEDAWRIASNSAYAFAELGCLSCARHACLRCVLHDPESGLLCDDLIEWGFTSDALTFVPAWVRQGQRELLNKLILACVAKVQLAAAASVADAFDALYRPKAYFLLIAAMTDGGQGAEARRLVDKLDVNNRDIGLIIVGRAPPNLKRQLSYEHCCLSAIEALALAGASRKASGLLPAIRDAETTSDLAREEIARGATRTGDLHEAKAVALEIKDLDVRCHVLRELAYASARRGEFPLAIELDASYQELRGRQGDSADGLIDFLRAKDDGEMKYLLSEVVRQQCRRGKFADATHTAGRVRDPEVKAASLATVGRRLAEAARYDEAISLAERLTGERRESVWESLAEQKAMRGDITGAKVAADRMTKVESRKELDFHIAVCDRLQGSFADFDKWATSLGTDRRLDAHAKAAEVLLKLVRPPLGSR